MVRVGDRVRLRIKKHAAYPNEVQYDGRTAIVESVTDNPHFPILARIECDKGRGFTIWVRPSECEPIKEDGDDN